MKKHFTEEDKGMAYKNLKRCSISATKREMQNKTT